ncbi:MAG: hypothetical protein KME16_15050 [Scytolyngbya sp. HA4215-MV1]|jgi:hypothetical protein|nr:hypothetical protein [Scytolyngbya sp. HA4215-MV1]
METSSNANKSSLSSTCHRAVVKNWKTTAIGLVLAFSGFVVFTPDTFGRDTLLVKVCQYTMTGGFAALGLTSKDFDKNGEQKS